MSIEEQNACQGRLSFIPYLIVICGIDLKHEREKQCCLVLKHIAF